MTQTSEQARAKQRQGAVGQSVATLALHRLGVQMAEEIATPVILKPARKPIQGKPTPFYVTYGKKVSGDHRGVMPGGRSVLAETKSMRGERLVYSDLREHQPERLSEHAELGGLSLLIWASEYGTFVMEWPVLLKIGFKPGKGIGIDQAKTLDIVQLLPVEQKLNLGDLVVVAHFSDFDLMDATHLGKFAGYVGGSFFIEGHERGYKYCRKVCP